MLDLSMEVIGSANIQNGGVDDENSNYWIR